MILKSECVSFRIGRDEAHVLIRKGVLCLHFVLSIIPFMVKGCSIGGNELVHDFSRKYTTTIPGGFTVAIFQKGWTIGETKNKSNDWPKAPPRNVLILF